jgi:hypothetical protein
VAVFWPLTTRESLNDNTPISPEPFSRLLQVFTTGSGCMTWKTAQNEPFLAKMTKKWSKKLKKGQF